MPHTVIKLARGTTTQCNAYAGPSGEVIIDTTAGTIVVQNGSAGGVRLARYSDLQSVVSFTATQTSGTKIGSITINGTAQDIYAPAASAQPVAYTAGTGISISGTNAISLSNSGVTAGSYGPSADASPAHSGTFSVPYITVDATGRVTAASTKTITLPAQYSLPNSGVTAGSYGPSANASPAYSGTFSVPYITVDAQGRVTAASTKTITLPADNNTDTKVTQTVTTTNSYYPLLFKYDTSTSSTTFTTRFGTTITANPYRGVVKANQFFGTVVALSSTAFITVSDGACFTKTLTADTTFTFSGGEGCATFSLILTNGGNYTVTWPSRVKWAGGTAPTLTSDGVDVLTFLTPDSGVTWYGVASSIGAA